MNVFVVEHRIFSVETNIMEIVIMHVASTKEKALTWCENNTNIEEKKQNLPWWFAISKEEVDSSNHLDLDIIFLDWNANLIEKQPLEGYLI